MLRLAQIEAMFEEQDKGVLGITVTDYKILMAEIERLRAALERIAEAPFSYPASVLQQMAHKAITDEQLTREQTDYNNAVGRKSGR